MSNNTPPDFLHKNSNRKVVLDYYVKEDVLDRPEEFKYMVLERLNAKGIKFKNVSFEHCVFNGCYFNNCVFDTCNFTGCRFIGSNFHQTAFRGCDFRYAIFERTQLDDDILISEAPREENLRMHFSRSLRMNYQQLGDSKAVNKAIMVELDATSVYLYKSWRSGETYYKEKYPGVFSGIIQFLKWIEFWVLNFIWGNGESILKFIRTILLVLVSISVYDTNTSGNLLNVGFYWSSFVQSPAIFLGILSPENFTTGVLSLITGIKFVSFALLTTLLVKRFSRR
ncbi:pentapeptide repeat-containing protein [Thiomicrospira microaerophila]|uniref:pentapeptide repeat-containing protein n=1 Tax=Thiomicrospira microaerophila TaxID=406020 RepID=UPI00200EA5BD|nr:pentapeptide repeat-containing protein [Thiomicrospira microaerophila]UQB42516.1 pentapeptide repeat-containing protein [Thiomicrospira microaerophila]